MPKIRITDADVDSLLNLVTLRLADAVWRKDLKSDLKILSWVAKIVVAATSTLALRVMIVEWDTDMETVLFAITLAFAASVSTSALVWRRKVHITQILDNHAKQAYKLALAKVINRSDIVDSNILEGRLFFEAIYELEKEGKIQP